MIMLKVDNVSKQYILGQIGGTTLREELQRFWAKIRGADDPTSKIGSSDYKVGGAFMALNGISFSVKKGERVGIIGHNGAGKSTLLKLISRVTAPTAGTIGLNGRITSMLEVGTGFHGELTGRENIYMNGAILGMSKRQIDHKIEDIIDFSECRQFIDTPVKRYSSGMYVKLAFSVAAHLDSEIMIMDEVLAVGDMAFQKKCLEKMNDVSRQEGRSVLYVSHNMATIKQLCGRVIVMEHGRIIYDGNVDEAIAKYLDSSFKNETYVSYANYKRAKWLANAKIRILSAEFVNGINAVFEDIDLMRMKFQWENIADVSKVNFRIEIVRLDRTPVASSLLYEFYSGKAQNKEKRVFSLDISSLAPGKYGTNYIFFEKNDFGMNVEIECVPGLAFEVIRNGQKTQWDNKYWGNVMLPQVVEE